MNLRWLSLATFATSALAAVAPSAAESSNKRDLESTGIRRLDTRATLKCTKDVQFLKNGKCVACTTVDKDASKCSTAGKVTACKTKMFYSGKCYATASCPTGTYANTAKEICSTCTSRFPNSTKCTSKVATVCKSSYFLLDGACVKTCPDESYGSAGKCLPCSSKFTGSKLCTAYKATSCASSYFLSNGKCSKTCPTGQFGSSGKCSPCSSKFPGSASCSVYKALTCSSSYFLQSGKCTKTCPSGTYGVDGVCASCSSAFKGSVTCDASGALSCKSPLALFDSACETLLTTCENGKFINVETNRCDQCSELFENSLSCDATKPLDCVEGFVLQEDACVEETKEPTCDDGQYYSTVAQACTSCQEVFPGSLTCTAIAALTCSAPLVITNGKCAAVVTSCTKTQYVDSATNSCLECSTKFPHAGRCTESEIWQCELGWKFSDDDTTCIVDDMKCADGRYYNTDVRGCVSCIPFGIGYKTCNAAEGALTCQDGYLLQPKDGKGHCYKDCLDNQHYPIERECYLCSDTRRNAATCDIEGVPLSCVDNYHLAKNLYDETICSVTTEPSCGDGNYFNEEDNECQFCSRNDFGAGVKTCKRAPVGALSCNDGYVLYVKPYGFPGEQACAKDCKSDKLYAKGYNETCYPCSQYDEFAETCEPQNGSPLTCVAGYHIYTDGDSYSNRCEADE